MKRRGRRHGLALTLLCFALLVAPVLFSALPSRAPQPADARPSQDTVRDLGDLLSALPGPFSPAVALGPAADWLFPPEAGGVPAPPPSDIQGALDMVRRDVPWDPVPIPDAPAGEEPLLGALQAHAAAVGFDLPDLPLLRAQVASLRLVPEAEDALARLVLAYDEAVRLEAEAVRDLSPRERLLFGQHPDAVAAWFAEDSARTGADLAALHQGLVARVDFSLRLRAADLLLRTVEAVKDLLALPPAPLPGADGVDGPDVAADDATAAWPGTGDPDWDRVYALVGLGAGITDPVALPERPRESLPVALTNLAATLGLPDASDLPLDGIDGLPASLADAVATIVTARRVGLESGDATLHSLLLMEAAREARPTLEAWAAVLDLQVPSGAPDATALLDAALTPGAPSLLLARGRGLEPGPLPEPPALAALLEREGLPAADALAAAASLPAPVALGTAHALHGLQRLDAQREQVLAGLDPADRAALEQTATVTALLEAPSWTPAEAALVADWARAVAALGPDGLRALQQSQVDLLASVEAAVVVLTPYAAAVESGADLSTTDLVVEAPADPDLPWYRRVLSLLSHLPTPIGTASAQVPPSPVQRDCTTLPSSNNVPALSDCDQDIWFRHEAQERSILVTGFGATTVRPGVVDTNPTLLIDLGGGDTYRHPVGSTDGLATARVAIDLGGNDLYDPLPTRLGSGAAEGLGSLGVLWDSGGSDIHQHRCPDEGVCVGAHGYGANGGVGVLLDGAGVDTYNAPGSRAHGVGWNGGTGLLLDLGDGRDRLHAGSGQGYGSGGGSLGLLLNDGAGDNRYVTSTGNRRFQGGHSDGSAAVGVFVDLGGRGTFYRNLDVPSDELLTQYHSFESEPPVRKDDAVWIEATANGGLGLGVDSTRADDDGDAFPNLVELTGGSDPQDAGSKPGSSPSTLVDQVEDIIASIDVDDPGAILGDFLPQRDSHLCDPDTSEEWQCAALLHIGGTSDDAIEGPAHILIELGGDDTYNAEVAGPGNFTLQGTAYPGVGSFALDLSGDDDYLTPPEGGATQGAVGVYGLAPNLGTGDLRHTDPLSPASLLLDLSGNDEYLSEGLSQGAAWSRDCFAMNNPGAAWLVDLDGNDEYASDSRSQGYVFVRAGRAGLIDLLGEDTYAFGSQAMMDTKSFGELSFSGAACASVRDAYPMALLFDGAGKDAYHSNTQLDSPPDAANPVDVQAVFMTQGFNKDKFTSSTPITFSVFMDQGTDQDDYSMALASGGSVSLNSLKNDQIRYGGKGLIDGSPNLINDYHGFFLDSPTWFGNHQDTDGDGAPVVAEFASGSDPNDPDDNLGAFWRSLNQLDQLVADPEGVAGYLGLEEGGPALRIPNHLIIDGHSDSSYHTTVPFFVSLGGNNVYEGPHVGGAVPNPDIPTVLGARLPSSVTLLLDAGNGNTIYAPDPQDCTLTTVDGAHHRLCPSLGGATNGIAIVADGGGVNTFHTVGDVDVEAEGSLILDLITQGAAVDKSVGALVTWDSENTFLAELTARANRMPNGKAVDLTLRGVAQGASTEGLGLLASLDGGADSYEIRLTSRETNSGDQSPSLQSMGQGAAWTDVGLGGVPNTRSASYGILLDGGGTNSFKAPSGFAQGFAAPGESSGPTLGILWSGTGDDRYEAQRFSQGSSLGIGSGALGLLYDAGGNDGYLALPTGGDDGLFSQGAGSSGVGIVRDAGGTNLLNALVDIVDGFVPAEGGGTGVLVDVAGDDWYEAQSTHAQGVGAGGTGLLLDGGGHDQYDAAGSAQGYASDSRTAVGVLVDVQGHDRYRVGSDGMGYAGSGCALFVDAAGDDHHSGNPAAGNERTWTQGLCAAGVDANALDASSFYEALPPVEVELEVFSGSSEVEDGGEASGDILLRASIDMVPSNPELIHRVSFLGSSRVLGHGVQTDDPFEYEFLWKTASAGFPEPYPDGTYKVWVSVFLDTQLDAGAAGQPDLPALESLPKNVLVNNPPVVTMDVEALLVSPSQGPSVPMSVQVGRDLEWPEGVDGETLCQDLEIPSADCFPGASLHLARTREEAPSHPIGDEAYYPAGTHSFQITGLDGGTPWEDGWYELAAAATDASDNLQTFVFPHLLLVDGTPPTSTIALSGYANEKDSLGGGSSLRLPWSHSDGDGSGVTNVCIFQFADDDGDGASTLACLHPDQPPLRVDGVETGDVLHFLTTAVDGAGNLESPCLKGEEAQLEHGDLCSLRKASDGIQSVTVDFDKPSIGFGSVLVNGVEPRDAYVRPGTPVNVTVQVDDVGAGVERVEIQLPGAPGAQMKTLDGVHYWYDEWGTYSGDLGTGREEPFIISITVWDRARNNLPELQTATLDDRPPAVIVQGAEYVEVGGETQRTLLAGRPGVYADVRARIVDAALESITLDVSALTGVDGDIRSCSVEGPASDPGLKTCRIRIPQDVEDGDYPVRFNATDRAGNHNATEAGVIQVRSKPLDLRDIEVVSVGHDRFRVEWSTPFDGTSTVHYGLTGAFGQATSLDGHRTDHSVEVTGLAPSSTYSFEVVSENTAGIPSKSPMFKVTTLNAYTFGLAELPQAPLRAVVDVGYAVSLLEGDTPIHGTLKVQDAAGDASPFEVATVEMAPGSGTMPFDTNRFADGAYRFVFELDRAGDFLRFESPVFRIDNTEPVVLPVSPQASSTVAAAEPEFEAILLDSMGQEPPVLQTLRVRVDGQEVPVEVLSDHVVGSSSLQRRVVFTLGEDLEPGPHEVEVSVSDRAGNVGRFVWPLGVDTAAPTLDGAVEAAPVPGPEFAKPGGHLRFVARLLDDAGVASAWLDLSGLGGSDAPLLAVDGRWEATVAVPMDAPHGRVQVPVVAVDALGNEGVAGTVEVRVDTVPPRVLKATARNVTYTSVDIGLATDKPTRAWVGGGAEPAPDDWHTAHELHAGGLAPGEDNAIALHVVDRAGYHVVTTFDVTTQDDDVPPSAVDDLSVSTPAEGIVVLSWSPATDNAGIQRYHVERSAAPGAPAVHTNLTHDATTFRDGGAPAGRTVTYRITPVDVAGLEGPVVQQVVDVLAVPHLSDASVTPRQGSAGELFTFQVEYRHAGDRAADTIHVRVGDQTRPLHRVDGDDPCHDGCLYRARVRLPPSSLFGSDEQAWFEATTAGHPGVLAVDLPFVLRGSGDGGVIDLAADGRAAPGPTPLVLLLLLATCATLLHRRNRR